MAKNGIAILGGGMGSLTAAFELTNDPGWRDELGDITVYQLGWRLGGKGASGRNREVHQRIEEHGLHIFLGFYENAFGVMKAAYAELGRPAGAPLAKWDDAFKPHDYVVLMEKLENGSYVPWAMDFPPNSGVPGCGGVLPTPWELLEMVLGWLKQILARKDNGLPDTHASLDAAHAHAQTRNRDGVVASLHELHGWLHQKLANVEASVDWRRDFVTIDLGIAATKGVAASPVVWSGDWFALDTMDFRAWLSHWGARDVSVNSAYITGMYDLGFSLPGQVGAGTAINGILRMCWTYKGAVMWKMQAGMGDTIFAPLYQVLKNRGVRFEFFSRIDELTLSDDHARIASITIGRQATPIDGTYEPLVEVRGLPCWPSEPHYEQLVEGAQLRDSGDNLEDWWTAWKDPVEPRVLRAGEDFDKVILGCSPGVFPYIAKDLIAHNKPFAAMVENVKTTQTQAMQLWLRCDLAGLGWTYPSPVLDAYAEPMDTWADMTHLLPREDWPADKAPANLAYLCSPLPDDVPPPPRDQHGYAQKQNERVHANGRMWLQEYAHGLWPGACPRGDFDWNLLVCDDGTSGAARFDSQYWIATMNPSDRYVLAYPNSVQYRLTTQGHGIANLYLAGDYIKTGMNVGCVEAATMGGMHASQKICGRPATIIGDNTDPIAASQVSAVQAADDASCRIPGANEMGPYPRRAANDFVDSVERAAKDLVDRADRATGGLVGKVARGAKDLADSAERVAEDAIETLERDTKGIVDTAEHVAESIGRGAKGFASRAKDAMTAAIDAISAGHEGRTRAPSSSTSAREATAGTPYIARGGDLAMAPPLALLNTTMYSFLLDADIGALRSLIDRQLNAVTRSAGVTYRPLLPAVSFVCADVTKSYSTTPPDSLKGWMSERDFGIWIPIVSNTNKLGWYLPYVFVDNVAAMVTGREVFGFFKQTATLRMPPAPSATGAFEIDDALVIETFSPSSQGKPITLLTAASTADTPAKEGSWSDKHGALAGVLGELRTLYGERDDLALSSWQLLENAFGEMITGDVPMVFLKQVRGETAAPTAAYQAVIEAPAHLDKFHGGWFCHPHDITITPAASHPIAKDCGLASSTLRSRLGFWCQMDFTMRAGRVVAGG